MARRGSFQRPTFRQGSEDHCSLLVINALIAYTKDAYNKYLSNRLKELAEQNQKSTGMKEPLIVFRGDTYYQGQKVPGKIREKLGDYKVDPVIAEHIYELEQYYKDTFEWDLSKVITMIKKLIINNGLNKRTLNDFLPSVDWDHIFRTAGVTASVEKSPVIPKTLFMSKYQEEVDMLNDALFTKTLVM